MTPTTFTWWAALLASAVVHGALVLAPAPGRPEGRSGAVSIEILEPRSTVVQPPAPIERPRPPARTVPTPRRRTPIAARTLPPPPPAAAPQVIGPSAPPAGAMPAAATGSGGVTVPAATGVIGPPMARTAPVHVLPPAASDADRRRAYEAYLVALRGLVDRQRRYPEMAAHLGQEGTVDVYARIGPAGTLVGPPSVASSSGFPLLDDEALRMVRRAAPFPSLPSREGRVEEITIPIRFQLEE